MLEYFRTMFRLFADSLDWFLKVGKAIIDSIEFALDFFYSWIPEEFWVIISVFIVVTVMGVVFKLIKFF